MNGDFVELTQDEMLSINGGMEQWKKVAYTTTGVLLVGHSVLIGVVGTPIMGKAVAKVGIDLIKRARDAK